MSLATITWINGPVLRARPEGPFRLREAVTVGTERLLGEVIRIARDQIVVQVYEDTSGLRPGVEVNGSGRLLSVRLGPGILGNIFDGLLRPLSATAGAYVIPGMGDETPGSFPFRPRAAVGDHLVPGAVLGESGHAVLDEGEGRNGGLVQRCLVAPDLPGGEVVWMAPAGVYREDEPVCRLRDANALCTNWPCPTTGRCASRGRCSSACLRMSQWSQDSGSSTACFPSPGVARRPFPGASGPARRCCWRLSPSGATPTSSSMSAAGSAAMSWRDCSEFLELEDPRSGRPLLERTVVIANTSNMTVSAREASIYTGITVAEYFRDQGLNVTLMADSTSRWAEALREVSGRLGNSPAKPATPPTSAAAWRTSTNVPPRSAPSGVTSAPSQCWVR